MMEACDASVLGAWLILAHSQASPCGAFVLPPRTAPTRANNRPAAARRFTGSLRSRPPSQVTLQPAAAAVVSAAIQPLLRPPALFARRFTPGGRAGAVALLRLSGAVGGDASSDSGGGSVGNRCPWEGENSDCSNDSRTGGVATDEASVGVVQTETQRLMSMPTIDIKLELQMRGVEHRDAFEKVDLARRLAEARISRPSPPAFYDDDNNNSSDQPRDADAARRRQEATTPTPIPGMESEISDEEGEGRRGGGTVPAGSSAVRARDVAKASRMEKAALSRELNAMGVAHSRLSDVSDLARLYADRRLQAREDAEEARRFPRRVIPTPRGGGSGSGGGSGFASEGENRGREGRAHGKHRWQRSGRRAGGGDGGGGREDKRRGDTRERVTSGLPWTGGKYKSKAEVEEDEGGRGWAPAESDVAGNVTLSAGGGEVSAVAPGDVGDAARDGSKADNWSILSNARSVASSGSASGDGGAGDNGGRHGRASLLARADRMSSRELMKALDDLGVRYRIPAPRSELEEAFVSAVLAEDERNGGGARAGKPGDDSRVSANLVPISPFSSAGDEEAGGGRKPGAGVGSYHSALRWARHLNFDEVLEELKYRGVACDPRANYSYLTRVLADEVLADEELMKAGGAEGAYSADVEVAMSMSAQDIIRDLRAGGEKADVTLSKEELAQKLAEMKLRLRSEPMPDRGRGEAFFRGGDDDDERRRDWGADFPPTRTPGVQAGVSIDLLGHDGSGDGDDLLQGLEEAAKSVGGAALLLAKEAAAFVSETTAGFFPDAVGESTSGGGAPFSSFEQQRRRRLRQAGGRGGRGSGSGVGGDIDGAEGARYAQQGRRAQAVRERAGGVRRAAAGFAQSSVNQAGFAVAQSLANGVLRGAEAAADWAGDGALAREYVLLFVAAFCLVFKRGLGAAVALLVVIRFGRTAAQRLVSEGWKMERAKRARSREGGGGSVAVAAGDGGGVVGGATNVQRDTPSARYSSGRWPRRRDSAASAKAGASAALTNTEEKGRSPQKKGKIKKVKRRPAPAAGRPKKAARTPLWDSDSDDDSRRGCVVM